MKVYATVTGQRGKSTGKGDNATIAVLFTIDQKGKHAELGEVLLHRNEAKETYDLSYSPAPDYPASVEVDSVPIEK